MNQNPLKNLRCDASAETFASKFKVSTTMKQFFINNKKIIKMIACAIALFVISICLASVQSDCHTLSCYAEHSIKMIAETFTPERILQFSQEYLREELMKTFLELTLTLARFILSQF